MFGSSHAKCVVMGSAASRKLVALRCPALVTFVGVGTTVVSRGHLPSASSASNASRAHSTAHKHLKFEGPKVCVGAPYANVVVIGSAASSASSQLLALCCPVLMTFVGVGTTAVSPGQLPSGKSQNQQRQ